MARGRQPAWLRRHRPAAAALGLVCLVGLAVYGLWPSGRKSWSAILRDNEARQSCVGRRQLAVASELDAMAAAGQNWTGQRTLGGFSALPRFYQPPPAAGSSVVIVTQCTPDRLHKLEAMLAVWRGPVSVAVYIRQGREDLQATMRAVGHSRLIAAHATVHLLYSAGTPYPVNALRNLAIGWAGEADWLLLADVDFWPTFSATEIAAQLDSANPAPRTMFVMVALSANIDQLPPAPLSHQNITDLVDKRALSPSNLCPCYGCHGPTDFDKWRNAQQPYPVPRPAGQLAEPAIGGIPVVLRAISARAALRAAAVR